MSNTSPQSKKGDPNSAKTRSVLVSELLFVLLPLIVLAIVFTYQRRMAGLLRAPEWSFISAILLGQTLVKFVTLVVLSTQTANWQRVIAVISGIIVLGIVPSLIVLSLILVTEFPSAWLTASQLVIFVISLTTYFVIGGASQYGMIEDEESKSRRDKKELES